MATAAVPMTDSPLARPRQQPELQVRLCGSSAKVSLQADEGIDALRARVAGAFGLTTPFDLMGPEGTPLCTDDDAAGAATKAALELSVSVGEDALLDLERAHEESGALRWALLRQILGDMRTKMAEMVTAISDGQRRTAVLDQQVLREKNAREAADSALKAEVAELKEQLAVETHKIRQEAKVALEAASADVIGQIEALAAAQRGTLQRTETGLKEALQAESAGRQREADETLRRFLEVRAMITTESETRVKALDDAAAVCAALQKGTAAGDEERCKLQQSMQAADALLTKEIEQLATKLNSATAALESSLAEAATMLQTESTARSSGLECAEAAAKALAVELANKIGAVQAFAENRLAGLEKVEPALRALVADETAARNEMHSEHLKSVEDVMAKLESEVTERRSSEEKTAMMITVLQDAADREQRTREASASEYGHALGSLTAQLEAQGKNEVVAEAQAALKAEMAKLQDALTEFTEQERAAREAACSRIAAAESERREALAAELRLANSAQAQESRQWSQTLAERLSTDLRGEREALFQELKSRCEELANTSADRARVELVAEVKKVDLATREEVRQLKTAMGEDRRCYEAQARTAAQEVKAALEAHGDFAEALERKQRTIVERLQQNLQQEGQARDDIINRMGRMELDMQKVKGHLPILFASPAAFR